MEQTNKKTIQEITNQIIDKGIFANNQFKQKCVAELELQIQETAKKNKGEFTIQELQKNIENLERHTYNANEKLIYTTLKNILKNISYQEKISIDMQENNKEILIQKFQKLVKEYDKEMPEIQKLVNQKQYEEAKNRLHKLGEQSIVKEPQKGEYTFYCFSNYIEFVIFREKHPQEKRKNLYPGINLAEVYYELAFIAYEEKEFDIALENIEKAIQWNPVNVRILFEKAAIFRAKNKMQRFRAEIEKIYNYIYSPDFLAKFYRELGYYYIEMKDLPIANALYTNSVVLFDTEIAKNELQYIANLEKREAKLSTPEEVKNLFIDYNIPLGFSGQIYNCILTQYEHLKQKNVKATEYKLVCNVLYNITRDKKYLEEI